MGVGFDSSQDCTSRRQVQFENGESITSDHESRKARTSSHEFLFAICPTKSLNRYVSIATFVLHSITYMTHSSLTNQKRNVNSVEYDIGV